MPRLSAAPTVDRLRDGVERSAGRVRDDLVRARQGFEWRQLAFAVVALFAFTVPFAASAARDEASPAPAAVLEPPAAAAPPALPELRKVAALPVPPKPAPPRRPSVPAAPTAAAPAAPVAPVATPAPAAPPVAAPAPAPPAPPAPSRERFDLEG